MFSTIVFRNPVLVTYSCACCLLSLIHENTGHSSIDSFNIWGNTYNLFLFKAGVLFVRVSVFFHVLLLKNDS